MEQEKDREKKKVGGRPELNEKKCDRNLELEIKNKRDMFLLEEHENFVGAMTK